MKKEELKKKLEPKKFNDVTMEFLTTAVNDVLKLYGEYISENVIIERIKQNLDKDIEFERNLGKNIAGSYNFGEKNIKIKKKSIDEERQVFFHEFLHCVSVHQKTDGKISTGFIGNIIGVGINEAMTEYLTKQRYPKLRGGYDEEEKVMKKLLEIIPIEEMIQSYLYGKPEIKELTKKYGMDSFNLLYSLDELFADNKKYSSLENKIIPDENRIDAKQQLIFEYVKGYCSSRKLEEIDIEELMNNVVEFEGILETMGEKSDFDYMQYINRIIAQKLQLGIGEEELKQLPNEYIVRINQQRVKEKIYNKTRKRILDEDFSREKNTYEDFYKDNIYMEKIIKKICGEGTILEKESMKFNWVTRLWNEIKLRYPDIDFDWIDFGFINNKYIIARLNGKIIGAMNIDIDDEIEYQKYKQVVESEKGSKKYRIINKDNEYLEINEAQDEGTYYQNGEIGHEQEDVVETFKRLEKLHETRRQLEILKSLGAPSIAISRLEEEIEKLSHQEEREQRYKIEYSGDYLERQKENGEMEVDEYNIEVQKKNEWEKKHCKEVSVDDDTER